jgi:hypothetical protein
MSWHLLGMTEENHKNLNSLLAEIWIQSLLNVKQGRFSATMLGAWMFSSFLSLLPQTSNFQVSANSWPQFKWATIKSIIFQDVSSCSPMKVIQHIGRTYRLHHEGWISMKAGGNVICCSEISVNFQQTTWRYIPEDSTLHNHRCDSLDPASYYQLMKAAFWFPELRANPAIWNKVICKKYNYILPCNNFVLLKWKLISALTLLHCL